VKGNKAEFKCNGETQKTLDAKPGATPLGIRGRTWPDPDPADSRQGDALTSLFSREPLASAGASVRQAGDALARGSRLNRSPYSFLLPDALRSRSTAAHNRWQLARSSAVQLSSDSGSRTGYARSRPKAKHPLHHASASGSSRASCFSQ
jgi:hypothetical protein